MLFSRSDLPGTKVYQTMKYCCLLDHGNDIINDGTTFFFSSSIFQETSRKMRFRSTINWYPPPPAKVIHPSTCKQKTPSDYKQPSYISPTPSKFIKMDSIYYFVLFNCKTCCDQYCYSFSLSGFSIPVKSPLG